MSTAKYIQSCGRIYASLLFLYPKEYRLEYGQEMTRLFLDQCRSSVAERGKLSLLALWLRTLADLFKTVLIENFASPLSRAGLLQAPAGKPLPWKGVLLVLLPGLAYMICQIGTLNGKDWFFSVVPWLGYACIAPVLVVWIVTRKFPVWGLLPLGLVLAAIRWDLQRWIYQLSLSFVIPLRSLITPNGNNIVGDGLLGIPVIFTALALLWGWLTFRRYKFSWKVWLWLGVYALTVVAFLIPSTVSIVKGSDLREIWQAMVFSVTTANNSDAIFLLLLALLGTLLARRHGKFAILIFVGYLLPTVLFGTYQTFPGGTTADIPPAWITTSILAFRVCLAILIPIWLARSTSRHGQVLATIVPVAIALIAENGLRIARYTLTMPDWNWNDSSVYLIGLLMTLAGFMLALTMYQVIQPVQTAPPTADTAATVAAEV